MPQLLHCVGTRKQLGVKRVWEDFVVCVDEVILQRAAARVTVRVHLRLTVTHRPG